MEIITKNQLHCLISCVYYKLFEFTLNLFQRKSAQIKINKCKLISTKSNKISKFSFELSWKFIFLHNSRLFKFFIVSAVHM